MLRDYKVEDDGTAFHPEFQIDPYGYITSNLSAAKDLLSSARYGSISVQGGKEKTVHTTGLDYNTPYDVYFLAVDSMGNYLPLIKLDAATNFDRFGFIAQQAEPDNKPAGQIFDLRISDAKDSNGGLLNGSHPVIVITNQRELVYFGDSDFDSEEALVPVRVTTAGEHTLTAVVSGVTHFKTVNVTVTGSGSGGGDSGSSTTPATLTNKATVSGISTSETSLPVNVNTQTGNAVTDLRTPAEDIFSGTGTTVLTLPTIPGVSSYTVK